VAIDLSQFKVQKCVLELRYATAFLLWDRAGSIASQLSKHYPNLKLKEVQPNSQLISVDEHSDAHVKIDSASVTVAFPTSDLNTFKKLASVLFPLVIDKLELDILSRIGFRVFFEKAFKNREGTAAFVAEITRSMPRKSKYFGFEGKMFEFDHAIRWETEVLGCLARIRTIQNQLDIEIPNDFGALDPVHAEKHAVQVDADYYAHAPTPIGKFDAVSIIESWYHLIRRDVGEFLDV
jgi:hypothetical protein